MADTQQLKAIITASASGFVDALKQATTAVNGSTADWRTRLAETQNNIKTAEGAVRNLAETAKQLEGMNVDINGIPELAGQLDTAGRNLEQLRADVNGAVDSLTRLRNEGSKLGINFTDYQRLSEAVQSAGADMGKFGDSIRQMNSMVQGLANGVPEAVSEFNRLGLSIEELASKSPVQQMDAIATAIDRLVDPIQRAEAANRMFASSLADVQKVNDEYRKSLQTNASGTRFATDQDLNRLVQQGNALDKIAASLAGVQAQAAQPAEMDIVKQIDEAIARCTDFTEKSKAMRDEYLEMSARMNGATEEHVLKSSNAWDAYFKKVRQTYKDIEAEAKAASEKSRIGFGGGGSTAFDEGFTKKYTLMLHQFDVLRKEVEQVRAKAEKGFGLNTKADTKAADELMARLNAVRNLFKDLESDKAGGPMMASQFAAVKQDVDGLRTAIEQGNAAIEKMNASSNETVSIWTLMREKISQVASNLRHPIEYAKRLWREMTHVQRATADAVAGGKSNMEQFIGMLTGMGSKMMVLVKTIREVGNAINHFWLEPFRNAHKIFMEMAQARVEDNRGVYDWHSSRAKGVMQALPEYYAAYERASQPDATYEDKANELRLREALERQGVDIDPSKGGVDRQVEEALSKAKDDLLESLNGRLLMYNKGLEDLDKALARATSYWRRIGLSQTQIMADQNIMAVQKEINRMKDERGKVIQEILQLEKATPATDFRRGRFARKADREVKAQKDQAEKDEKARSDREKALVDAADELEKWSDEASLSEGQRRINDILDKYRKMLEAGVTEAEARPVMEAALRKELQRQYNDELEARKRLVDEYKDACRDAEDAIRREREASKSLADAMESLAEIRRRQANDERLEALSRKREKIREALGRFGFQLDKSFRMREAPGERRERRRNNRLDESINRKLARREQGRPVHFTSREQGRLDAYRRLQKKDAELSKEEKAIKAAEMQYNASKSLQDAAAAIRAAAIELAKSGGVLPKDLKKILEKTDKEAEKKRKKSGAPATKRERNRLRHGGEADKAVRRAKQAGSKIPQMPKERKPGDVSRQRTGGGTTADAIRKDAGERSRQTPAPKPQAGGIPQASIPDLSKALAGVVLPERMPTGELPKDHDYTSLLEGIRTAIENGNQNKFTVV